MALKTCGDLIAFALRAAGINGVGQTPLAEDLNDAMVLLIAMVAGWQTERWMVPDVIDVALTSTGALSYTIGPGANFSVTRPTKIDSAFVRLLQTSGQNTFDYPPLAIIETREAYNAIGLKALSSIPRGIFYDSAYPIGNLFFWPVPPASLYELHVGIKGSLPVYVAPTDLINLPPVYTRALVNGLAIELSGNYGTEPRPGTAERYADAVKLIKAANFQIGELSIPSALTGQRGYPSTGQLIGGMW